MTTKTITKQFNVFATTKNITEDDDGTLYIEGIANTGKEDLVGDIVTETALKQIVEQAPQRNLHYNHDDTRKDLLGRIIEAELRPEGAWIKTRILDEQKEWLKSYLEQGILFGQSISGCCTYEDGSYDEIVAWDLTEISLTDTPCDQGTMGTVSISKSFDDLILSLKRKEDLKEKNSMAEELSRDDVIDIVNDAYNERKEELLEQIRENIAKEYDVKLNELTERLNTLEAKLEEPDPKPADGDGDKDGDPANDDDDDKSFEEAVEKAVQERLAKAVEEETEKKVKAILENLNKSVNPRYDAKKHVKDDDKKSGEEKAYSAREIAEMLG